MIMLSQMGNLEACVVSAAPLAQYAEPFNVLVMPFVFRDNEHQYAVVDGAVGAELGEHLRSKNLRAAAFFDSGSRNVMTMDGPVRSPEDLRGKIFCYVPSAASGYLFPRAMLRKAGLDPDMVDELARTNINLGHPHEITILLAR